MLGWIIRIILGLAGLITSLFIAREALNFAIIQMVVGMILFTLTVIIVAFWPTIKDWCKRIVKSRKNH